jgi:hypothetical protein
MGRRDSTESDQLPLAENTSLRSYNSYPEAPGNAARIVSRSDPFLNPDLRRYDSLANSLGHHDHHDANQDQVSTISNLSSALARANQSLHNATLENHSVRERMDNMEREATHLRAQLESMRDMMSSPRIADEVVFVEQFKMINTHIMESARSIASAMVTQFRVPSTSPVNPLNETTLATIVSPALIRSSSGAGRPIQIFIEMALREQICKKLARILSKFHPNVNNQDWENCVEGLYKKIRTDEAQLAAGRWRASTYTILEGGQTPEGNNLSWSTKFAGEVETTIVHPLVTCLWGADHLGFILPPESRKHLIETAISAYNWSRVTKTRYLPVDFHAVMLDDKQVYHRNSARMMLDRPGDMSGSSGAGSKVIACVGMGLHSTITYGTLRKMAVAWQIRVTVLTEDSFM